MENFKQFLLRRFGRMLSESHNDGSESQNNGFESQNNGQTVVFVSKSESKENAFRFTFQRLGDSTIYQLFEIEPIGNAKIPVDFEEYKTQEDKFRIYRNMVEKWKENIPPAEHFFERMREAQGRAWMMITKTDMEFFSTMHEFLKKGIYTIDNKNKKIFFNLINKTIDLQNNENIIEQIKEYKDEFFGKKGVDINIDETQEQLLNVHDAIEFRNKFYGNPNDNISYTTDDPDDSDDYSSEEENVNEDILNKSEIKIKKSKPVKNWEKKEVSVRDGLNLLINGEDDSENHVDEPGAAWVGGSNDSDVMYTIKDQDKNENMLTGFVEVKLNYADAGYFKFSLQYKDDKIKKVRDTYYRNRDDRKSSYTDIKFNNLLTKIMKESVAVKDKFEQLGENVQFCIDSLNQIENVKTKINFKPENAKNFPDGFEELAKVFNFFVLEWVRKFMFLSSNYIYLKLDKKEEEAKKQISIATKIKEKFKKLCGDDGRLMFSDEFTKFREIYKLFISTDDFLPGKNQNTDGDVDQNQDEIDKKYTLFTFEDSESADKDFKNNIIDKIDSYYKKKGCRYIEIGDDVYLIGGNSNTTENPLKLKNLQNFKSLKQRKDVGVKVVVSVKDASKLHLTMYFKTEEQKLTDSGSIEDIAKKQQSEFQNT